MSGATKSNQNQLKLRSVKHLRKGKQTLKGAKFPQFWTDLSGLSGTFEAQRSAWGFLLLLLRGRWPWHSALSAYRTETLLKWNVRTAILHLLRIIWMKYVHYSVILDLMNSNFCIEVCCRAKCNPGTFWACCQERYLGCVQLGRNTSCNAILDKVAFWAGCQGGIAILLGSAWEHLG